MIVLVMLESLLRFGIFFVFLAFLVGMGWWMCAGLVSLVRGAFPRKPQPPVQNAYWRHQSRLQYEAWARMDQENAKKTSIFQV